MDDGDKFLAELVKAVSKNETAMLDKLTEEHVQARRDPLVEAMTHALLAGHIVGCLLAVREQEGSSDKVQSLLEHFIANGVQRGYSVKRIERLRETNGEDAPKIVLPGGLH